MAKLTYIMENYLEAIYELSKGGNGARISDIAEKMGVTKASANSAMATLSEKGLVSNEKYKEIFLTAEGMKIAEFTAQKHQIIKQFLSSVLRVDLDVADEDACAIEHVISDLSISAMKEFLLAYKTS